MNTLQSSQQNLQITLTVCVSSLHTIPNVKTAHFENIVVDRRHTSRARHKSYFLTLNILIIMSFEFSFEDKNLRIKLKM